MKLKTPAWFAVLPESHLIAEYSLWSANLLRLEDDLLRIKGHADVLHIDVADGHFAPAMLFFPDLVAAIKAKTSIPLHVHLMVADQVLLSQIEQFADAGSDLISIHAENAEVAHDAIDLINNKGKVAGMVLKVSTPVSAAQPYLEKIQFLTLLGTAIGVKGQSLDASACDRLREARRMVAQSVSGRRLAVAADGGIREHTVPQLRGAGAETVVLGSLAFGASDLSARMAWLKSL